MEGIVKWIADLFRSFQWWAVVNPWERGVRVRLGKSTSLLNPGWHWRIPIADKVWIFNNRLRLTSFPAQTLTTTDGKTITVAGLVGFRIADPLAAMRSLQQPEYSCAALTQTAVTEYVCEREFGEIDRSELEAEALDILRRTTNGFEFEFVRATDFASVRAIRLLQETWRPETRPDREPDDR
jgi:regulator of protease activity HflC (stomatin/prohibitin superfamily)